MSFSTEIEKLLKETGRSLKKRQKEQFYQYRLELLKWNSKINLISRKSEKNIYHHFIESLSPLFVIDFSEKDYCVLDIGTGAGFPGIPLKIMFPSIKLTLIDASRKKTLFLQKVISILELKQVYILCARVENLCLDQKYIDRYDFAVCRAVGRLKLLVSYSYPLLKKGGSLIAIKGGELEGELSELDGKVDPQINELSFGILKSKERKIIRIVKTD